MPRFVILRHEFPATSSRQSHWDLMLEADGVLNTWELSELPAADHPVAAAPLADHRLAYLDYEGPVSGNRGAVTRIDVGEIRWLADSTAAVRVMLQGATYRGGLTIECKSDSAGVAYWATFVPAD